jgi:hypothetical protein
MGRHDAAVAVVSIPKSGRTWIRFFLGSYFSLTAGVDFSLTEASGQVVYTHDLWDHLTSRRFVNCVSARYLLPREMRSNSRILLLSRDPRDVIVSLYFELSKRERRYRGTLSELVRHPLFGVEPLIVIMNKWMGEWGAKESTLLVRYEDLHFAPEPNFERLVRFVLPNATPERAAVKAALKRSRFESMQEAERSGRFVETIMRPGDPSDPESFKVRKGLVGGYRDYLTEEDIAWIESQMDALDPRYQYSL